MNPAYNTHYTLCYVWSSIVQCPSKLYRITMYGSTRAAVLGVRVMLSVFDVVLRRVMLCTGTHHTSNVR